jgi:hypothetical protein
MSNDEDITDDDINAIQRIAKESPIERQVYFYSSPQADPPHSQIVFLIADIVGKAMIDITFHGGTEYIANNRLQSSLDKKEETLDNWRFSSAAYDGLIQTKEVSGQEFCDLATKYDFEQDDIDGLFID